MSAAAGGRGIPVFGLLVGMVGAVIGALVVYPLGRLLYSVFFTQGAFSEHNVVQAMQDPALGAALRNTLGLVLVAGGGAIAIGALLAWLNDRTDAHMGWAGDILAILPLLVPAVAGAAGWVFLFAPQAGFLNVLVRSALPGLGATGPVNIYSLEGMVFVTCMYAVPFAYLTVSAALRNMDPALEEASRMSGAGLPRTLFQVTLPAIRTALATAAVLVLMSVIAMFSIPVLIGLPAHVDVLTSVIYRALNASFPPRIGDAVVLSGFMLLTVQLAVVVEYAIRRAGHQATVGGRAHLRSKYELGLLRWPARVAMTAYLGLVTVLPVGSLALVSLQGFWSPSIAWDRLSLHNYVSLFSTQNALTRAFIASLVLATITATVLMLAAALVDFYVQSSPGVLARFLNAVATLPSSVPHTVIAIGFLVALGVGERGLGGTYLLLFLAYLVLLLPQATRAAGAALSQVGRDVWEASLMSGAGPLRTFARILLPLMLVGLIAGWVVVFVGTFSEVSGGAFLTGTTNPVVGPVILDIWQNSGTFPQLAALTLIVTLLQTAVVLAVLVVSRDAFSQRSA